MIPSIAIGSPHSCPLYVKHRVVQESHGLVPEWEPTARNLLTRTGMAFSQYHFEPRRISYTPIVSVGAKISIFDRGIVTLRFGNSETIHTLSLIDLRVCTNRPASHQCILKGVDTERALLSVQSDSEHF